MHHLGDLIPASWADIHSSCITHDLAVLKNTYRHNGNSMPEPIKEVAPIIQHAANVCNNYTADFIAMINSFTPDALANGFSTLVGALVGAMLAYFLQRKSQKSVDHEIAQVAGHQLMFALLQQINCLVLIQRDFVFEHIESPGRFLSIPPTPPFDIKKNVLDLPELSFLLNSKDGRAILYDYYIAQENYIEAISQWNMRSSMHLEKVQPALAANGLKSGEAISEEMLQQVLGAHVYGSMVNSTENCIISLRRSFQKLSAVKVDARAYLVRRFKTEDFTDFSIPENFGLSD